MELRKQPAHVAPARAASTSALRLEASQQASEASETSELCAHVLQTKHTGGARAVGDDLVWLHGAKVRRAVF